MCFTAMLNIYLPGLQIWLYASPLFILFPLFPKVYARSIP